MTDVPPFRQYTIRRAFLFPLGLLLLLCVILLVVAAVNGEPLVKLLILVGIIIPVVILFIESCFRKTVVGDEEVTVRKLLREKRLRFEEITEVETIMVKKRVFMTLCAGEEFLILSNAYGNFPCMVADLLSMVPPQSISEETRKMAESPPVKSTDIVSCWLGVVLIAFILYVQLGGWF